MSTKPEPSMRPAVPGDQERARDATIIAHVVALIHSRRKGDYLQAADAHRELVRLGVVIKFPRQTKAVSQ